MSFYIKIYCYNSEYDIILNNTKSIEKKGKKNEKEYDGKILEKCFPCFRKKIPTKTLPKRNKKQSKLLNCLIDELQSSVNSAGRWNITEGQCDYLYEKYIRMEK